jgi:hypothetical protein
MMIVEDEINGTEVLENPSPKYPVDVLVVPRTSPSDTQIRQRMHGMQRMHVHFSERFCKC